MKNRTRLQRRRCRRIWYAALAALAANGADDAYVCGEIVRATDGAVALC